MANHKSIFRPYEDFIREEIQAGKRYVDIWEFLAIYKLGLDVEEERERNYNLFLTFIHNNHLARTQARSSSKCVDCEYYREITRVNKKYSNFPICLEGMFEINKLVARPYECPLEEEKNSEE